MFRETKMAAWAGSADILRASSVKTAIKNTGIKCVSKLLYTGRHFWDRKRQIYSKHPQNALLTQFIFQKLAEGVIIIPYGLGRGFQAPFFRHRKVLRHIFYFVYKIEIFCIGMADKQKITEETMDIIIIGCGKVGTTLAEPACPGGLQCGDDRYVCGANAAGVR